MGVVLAMGTCQLVDDVHVAPVAVDAVSVNVDAVVVFLDAVYADVVVVY